MKKIPALAVALSILFFAGCTSTSIKYKTPRVNNLKVQNVNGQNLFFSSRASYANGQYLNPAQKGFVQRLIEQEFDQIFAETAAGLDAFGSVNKTFFKKNDDISVVNFNVKVQENENPLAVLLTLCSLGVIPSHNSTDFTVTYQYRSDEKSRMYTFEDSLSTWTGWFVGGTADPYEKNYKRRLLLENISRHALVKYDQDSSEGK